MPEEMPKHELYPIEDPPLVPCTLKILLFLSIHTTQKIMMIAHLPNTKPTFFPPKKLIPLT